MFLPVPLWRWPGLSPDVGYEFFGPLEAAHVANNGQERESVDEAHAEHLHGAQHHVVAAHPGSDETVEALAALFAGIQIAEVLGKDLLLHGRPVPLFEHPLPGALQLEVALGGADGVAVEVSPQRVAGRRVVGRRLCHRRGAARGAGGSARRAPIRKEPSPARKTSAMRAAAILSLSA